MLRIPGPTLADQHQLSIEVLPVVTTQLLVVDGVLQATISQQDPKASTNREHTVTATCTQRTSVPRGCQRRNVVSAMC